MSSYTPYQAAKLANVVFENNDIKPIPTQMMYNYTTARINKGKPSLIATVIVNGQVQIEHDELYSWITKYAAKKGVVLQSTTSTEIEGQLELL